VVCGCQYQQVAPSPVSAGITVTNTKVNVTLTAVGAGSYAPVSAYRIYRTNTLGTAFQFVAQVTGTTYTDQTVVLIEELPSTEWDPPPTDLKGFIMLPNGVIAAFRGNEIRLSEPGLAHAWPADYSYQTDFPIVALAPIDNGFAALTSGEPYLFIGTHPGAMAPAKLENSYACMSKRGVARFGNSAVYPSANGLAYVADADDLVPDNVPVLGLLDDAIMLELVLRELQHELDGYEEFDAYRLDEAPKRDKPGTHRPVSREDWLESRRAALHERIRERRQRDLDRDGEAFRLITHF
jgi:uncharacterized membrane protein YkvA (DUF1232 family)